MQHSGDYFFGQVVVPVAVLSTPIDIILSVTHRYTRQTEYMQFSRVEAVKGPFINGVS